MKLVPQGISRRFKSTQSDAGVACDNGGIVVEYRCGEYSSRRRENAGANVSDQEHGENSLMAWHVKKEQALSRWIRDDRMR